jgi:hypothetical protein
VAAPALHDAWALGIAGSPSMPDWEPLALMLEDVRLMEGLGIAGIHVKGNRCVGPNKRVRRRFDKLGNSAT